MIKAVRSMASMLGKLGIKCLIEEYLPPLNYNTKPFRPPSTYYGISLKDAADYTHNYLVRTGQKDDKLIPTRIRNPR